jgi:ribosomal-protein-alanine N-acetyltransferase
MTAPYPIRNARPADLSAIYLGELDYIRQIEPEQETPWKNGMQWHIRQWTDNLDRMFVAQGSEDLAGYCFWQIDSSVAVLASIYVVPQCRGLGLGRDLLDKAILDIRANGFSQLTLGVKPDNPARRLYETAGFTYMHDEGGYRHYSLDL